MNRNGDSNGHRLSQALPQLGEVANCGSAVASGCTLRSYQAPVAQLAAGGHLGANYQANAVETRAPNCQESAPPLQSKRLRAGFD
jgi:hypothetical protein